MQVSRQAVSKWETGEAYPDTDKLIALCDRFGVSMDDFVRGDITVSEIEVNEDGVQSDGCGAEDEDKAKKTRNQFKKFASRISVGVFLILVGVALCIALCGTANAYGEDRTADFLSVTGVVSVIVFVAVAVFLFVLAGISHNGFIREKGIACAFTKEENERFNKKFAVVTACLVSGMVLDVAALVAAFMLYQKANPSVEFEYSSIIVSVFMFVLAFLLAAQCNMGIMQSLYAQANALANRTESRGEKSRKERIIEVICGVIMLSATAAFLLMGFICNLWHPGWVVFPVGGIICSIVRLLSGINKG